jgi:hypothetical protein
MGISEKVLHIVDLFVGFTGDRQSCGACVDCTKLEKSRRRPSDWPLSRTLYQHVILIGGSETQEVTLFCQVMEGDLDGGPSS